MSRFSFVSLKCNNALRLNSKKCRWNSDHQPVLELLLLLSTKTTKTTKTLLTIIEVNPCTLGSRSTMGSLFRIKIILPKGILITSNSRQVAHVHQRRAMGLEESAKRRNLNVILTYLSWISKKVKVSLLVPNQLC